MISISLKVIEHVHEIILAGYPILCLKTPLVVATILQTLATCMKSLAVQTGQAQWQKICQKVTPSSGSLPVVNIRHTLASLIPVCGLQSFRWYFMTGLHPLQGCVGGEGLTKPSPEPLLHVTASGIIASFDNNGSDYHVLVTLCN